MNVYEVMPLGCRIILNSMRYLEIHLYMLQYNTCKSVSKCYFSIIDNIKVKQLKIIAKKSLWRDTFLLGGPFSCTIASDFKWGVEDYRNVTREMKMPWNNE